MAKIGRPRAESAQRRGVGADAVLVGHLRDGPSAALSPDRLSQLALPVVNGGDGAPASTTLRYLPVDGRDDHDIRDEANTVKPSKNSGAIQTLRATHASLWNNSSHSNYLDR